MIGRRKRLVVVLGVLTAMGAILILVTSTRDRPQATVVLKPGPAGSLVAMLSLTNSTERNFTVFCLLQVLEGAAWSEADEQSRSVGSPLILGKGKIIEFEVELPPVKRTYRFRCGYEPYAPLATSMQILYKLHELKLPGTLGEAYRKALTQLHPWPKHFVTDPFPTSQGAQVAAPTGVPKDFSSEARDIVHYSDSFRSHYPTRGRRFELDGYDLDAPIVVWDTGHHRKITVVRTDGGKYGYDQQRCLITISGAGLDQPRFLSVLDFRTVKTSWITEKFILIDLDIGHVAAVKAIYDVEDDKFVYRQSLLYEWPGGQRGPVAVRQPSLAPELVPQEPPTLMPSVLPEPPLPVPIDASSRQFLTKEAQGGATYEIGVYVVKLGDTLSRIAKCHDVTVKDLRILNPELTSDRILVGQQIRVYEKPNR
jgi:hypothetical protein